MEVILLQRVEKLGKLGDVVNVRPGYARNFLLPKKIALRATQENVAHFDKEKATLEKLNTKHKEEAEVLAARLEGAMAILIRQASESGQLYGSVTSRDIADALNNEHVKKNNIKIGHPIKTIGIHAVQVQLHPEVSVMIKVNAAMSEDEAKAQAQTFEHANAVVEEE
jgi:large subunit ribosomal protein L9